MEPAAPAGSRPPLPRLRPRHLLLVLAIVAFGVALRLRYFSGLGLGDDIILRMDIGAIYRGQIIGGANGYRFAWWAPTVLLARWVGLGETSMITPILVYDALGLIVVSLFAGYVWGPVGALIAGLLLAVCPLDVAWSTMLASDIVLSFFSALCIFAVVRALEEHETSRRIRAWILAAVALWLAFHSKVSAVFLLPAIVVVAWARRRELDASVLYFIGAAVILFGATTLFFIVVDGDPLTPVHGELQAQGLMGPEAATWHAAGWETFKVYPRWLFLRNGFGTFVYSIYPHLLLVLLVVGAFLGIPPYWPALWWLLFVFLGMELNVQRMNGVWVAGFRNIRHAHVLVYPIVICLTGYLVALRQRSRRAIDVVLAAVLVISLWESIATALITHIPFSDGRQAVQFLRTLPPKPTYSDFQVGSWFTLSGLIDAGWQFQVVRPDEREKLAAVTSGYLVTGGGREPYYGCTHCIPLAKDVPTESWTLLKEFPDPNPPTPWRSEPLRIWEAKPAKPTAP